MTNDELQTINKETTTTTMSEQTNKTAILVRTMLYGFTAQNTRSNIHHNNQFNLFFRHRNYNFIHFAK